MDETKKKNNNSKTTFRPPKCDISKAHDNIENHPMDQFITVLIL